MMDKATQLTGNSLIFLSGLESGMSGPLLVSTEYLGAKLSAKASLTVCVLLRHRYQK